MKDMENLTTIDDVDRFINSHNLSFIYVSRENCGVCHAVLPRLRELLDHYKDIHLGFVDASQLEEIAAKLSVFTVPALLLFIEGKEYLREARFVHFDELKIKLDSLYELYNE